MSRTGDTNWGAQAEGWAKYWGHLADPAREAVLETLGIETDINLLDIGCGSGELCALAAGRGARVSGLDAGRGMIEYARDRLPTADLRVGDASRLPWDDGSFDIVTAFNSLQFADDFLSALGEARRVTKSGGRVAICNWGRPEDCDLKPIFDALDEFPEREPPPDPPLPLGEPGELERFAREVGLEPISSAEVEIPYESPDRDALCEALLVDAGLHGTEDLEGAARTALELTDPFRRGDGSYRFENRFRYIIAVV